MAINGYELSRTWFDFCFENPEKIKPNHIALYFFIIEHCNRLGWKKKFGLPTTMAKEAIGIRSYNTYINTLNDLVKWGFVEMVEKSKNQYSSNIVALLKYNKANNKALDKALIKHNLKQDESIDTIDKQGTSKPTNKKQVNNIDFSIFWNLYDKKIDRPKNEKKWKTINSETQKKIIDYIPNYILSQPDKKYRKNPATFLNNKSWENEIILNEEFENGLYKKLRYDEVVTLNDQKLRGVAFQKYRPVQFEDEGLKYVHVEDIKKHKLEIFKPE